MTFTIEDELHAELCGEYPTLEAAIAELRRRMQLPWDHDLNVAPCMSWRTCGRHYEIVEYGADGEQQRIPALNVSAEGVVWLL